MATIKVRCEFEFIRKIKDAILVVVLKDEELK